MNYSVEAMDLKQYLRASGQIAAEAGELIMSYWLKDYETLTKDDDSPVTEADIAANHHICAKLAQLAPDIPIVAEENDLQPAPGSRFWLVDPLDGTRSFVRGEDEFTVNIGLIENGVPVLGVIYVPVLKTLYAAAIGEGCYLGGTAIEARTAPTDGLTVVRSKSHMSDQTKTYLDTLDVKEVLPGSSSLKFCLIAEGSADIYPRFGRTMEWDTAAGHAILNEAGGRVENAHGGALVYGKQGFENPHFIAYGK